MNRLRQYTAVGCAMLLVASPVSAANREKQDAGETQARAAAQVAKGEYERGEFASALASFEKAYALKAVPGLLFNIAQCHRQLGNHERAIVYFQRFLESSPNPAQANATRELMATEKAKHAASEKEKVEAVEQARRLEVERAREAAARAEAEAAQHRSDLNASIKEGPPEAVENRPAYTRWWFWTAIGAVAVTAAVTSVVVVTAPRPTPTTFPDINAR